MTPPRIVVTVLPDGTVNAETEGIIGAACLDYIAVLEDLLDARTVGSEYTADHHRTVSLDETRQLGHDVELA